jgi:hypothetical protein
MSIMPERFVFSLFFAFRFDFNWAFASICDFDFDFDSNLDENDNWIRANIVIYIFTIVKNFINGK